jgi:DNA polymerase-3 subunit epsilon
MALRAVHTGEVRSRPWWEEPSVAFDLETTGTDVETARIVTAAVVTLDAGLVGTAWTAMADPGVEIPIGASAVHGISTAMARAAGRPACTVIEELLTLLDRRAPGVPLIVMNAPFDLTVLDREARRHGLESLLSAPDLVIDPLVIARHLLRYQRGPKNLSRLCDIYGVELADAHTASADALAAARLARQICRHGRVVRAPWDQERGSLSAEWEFARRDASRLVGAQRGWDRVWRSGFANYLVAQGDRTAAHEVAAGDWPVQVAA